MILQSHYPHIGFVLPLSFISHLLSWTASSWGGKCTHKGPLYIQSGPEAEFFLITVRRRPKELENAKAHTKQGVLMRWEPTSSLWRQAVSYLSTHCQDHLPAHTVNSIVHKILGHWRAGCEEALALKVAMQVSRDFPFCSVDFDIIWTNGCHVKHTYKHNEYLFKFLKQQGST